MCVCVCVCVCLCVCNVWFLNGSDRLDCLQNIRRKSKSKIKR